MALAAARRALHQGGDVRDAGGSGEAGRANAPGAPGDAVVAPTDARAELVRIALPEAEVHAGRLLEYLERAPGIESVELAGDFRRRCPVLTGLEVLVVSARPAPVTRYFTTYADAAGAIAADMSRGTLTLNCGLSVDLRVVPRRCHGAALHHLTGSLRYTDAIRAFGLERHVRISEYGVFGLEEGRAGARRLGGHDEADIFHALDLAWIPPELREDTGEIDAARDGRLPELVRASDVRSDVFRTRRSSGPDTAEDVVRGCRDQGRDWCVIADPWATSRAPGLSPGTLREQVDELARLRRSITGIRIVHAVAFDVGAAGDDEFPGALHAFDALDEDVRGRVDLVLGLMPSLQGAEEPSLRAVREALRGRRLDILAVPPDPLDPADADGRWADVLKAAAEGDVVLLIPGSHEHAAGYARLATAAGVKVLLQSGAGVADAQEAMRHAVDQARRGWLESRQLVNAFDTVEMLQWLRSRRPPPG